MARKSKKKKHRKPSKEKTTLLTKNSRQLRKSANAILGFDFSEVPGNRVTQVTIGWLRAACYQSLLIAEMTSRGSQHSLAPNRRLFAELVIRCHWLYDISHQYRGSAIDTLLEKDRSEERKTVKHMQEMGVDYQPDLTDMEELELSDLLEGKLKNQASQLTAAAKGTRVQNFGLYLAWRNDSTYTHATALMAYTFAPASHDDKIGSGKPSTPDPDLEAHKYGLLLITGLAARILLEEGSDLATARALVGSYFN